MESWEPEKALGVRRLRVKRGRGIAKRTLWLSESDIPRLTVTSLPQPGPATSRLSFSFPFTYAHTGSHWSNRHAPPPLKGASFPIAFVSRRSALAFELSGKGAQTRVPEVVKQLVVSAVGAADSILKLPAWSWWAACTPPNGRPGARSSP